MGFKEKLRAYAVLVGINALAAVAFVVLTMTGARSIGYGLVALALIAVGWQAYRTGFASEANGATIAAGLGAQTLLAGAVFADYRRGGGEPHVVPSVAALAIAGGLLALLVLSQPVVEFLVNRPRLRVVNLAGYRAPRLALVSPSAIYWCNVGLIVLAGVFALASWNAWPLAAITLLVGALVGLIGAEAIYRRLRTTTTDRPFRAALDAYDPRFALYFSAPENTEYHVTMWLPYLERIGKPFIVILRESHAFEALAAATRVPVVHCPTVPFVDQVVTDGMRACFYVNNGAFNSHMVRFNQITHIQLLHGDSDKASSANPVTAMFDRIFVAGQAGIDRYAAAGVHIPADKFDIVGRPQVDTIRVSRHPIGTIADKTVLYATTWVGLYSDANYCSLSIAERIISRLLDRNVRVILRPHPYVARHTASALQTARLEQMLADDRVKSGRDHVFGTRATTTMSLFDCMNDADAMISDISAVASDWLYSEKPFALTNMLDQDSTSFEEMFPLAKAAYVIDNKHVINGDTATIDEVLGDLLDTDPIAALRRNVKTYYLGDFDPDAYSQGFIRAARRYAE